MSGDPSPSTQQAERSQRSERAQRFSPFADVLMLRLDIAPSDSARASGNDSGSHGDNGSGSAGGGNGGDSGIADADKAAGKPGRVHYITPFVTDGDKLYVFEEPGERSDELDAMLLNRTAEISSVTTGELAVTGTAQRPTPAEEAWARDACSARFHYDQALQDIAQLGTVIAIA